MLVTRKFRLRIKTVDSDITETVNSWKKIKKYFYIVCHRNLIKRHNIRPPKSEPLSFVFRKKGDIFKIDLELTASVQWGFDSLSFFLDVGSSVQTLTVK